MSLPNVKCLLVDDLEENLLALSALLRQDGVELLLARSATEALELLLVHDDVALAFLDVQMPEVDGFELAELMRGSQRTSHIPLIFVTAGANDQHRLFKGYESGAVDFLYKPIDPRILKNKADVFFRLHRQQRQLAHDLHERSETLRLNELFVAMLGHDLRNPLAALLVTAQAMGARHGDAEFVRKAATRLQASGKRMKHLIDDMFDLARARLGEGIALQTGEADLQEAIARVVDEHRDACPTRRIAFNVTGDTRGVWDAHQLARVASNLIGNALQHGAAASDVTVVLDGTRTDTIVFSVSNLGEVPAAVLPHIFDPFRAGDPRDGHGDGLGLGLYIVAQITKAHAGTVKVQSALDETRFEVTIPREPGRAA